MPDKNRLDRVYAELLREHEGWGLYRKVNANDMRPGSIGYFDSDGAWKPIVQLVDDDLRAAGWTRLDRSVDVQPNSGRIAWGPKASVDVRSFGIGAELGIPVPPAPGLEASATFKIEGSSEKGAILFTEAPITHEMVVDDSPLLQWFNKNSRKIVEHYGPQIKEHGIWIVTKTYATRRCVISILKSKSAEVSIGLGLDVTGFATLTPESTWSTSGGDVSTAMYEDEHGVVVFMCGIYITKRPFIESLKTEDRREKQKILRGGEQREPFTIRSLEPDGSELMLLVERY